MYTESWVSFVTRGKSTSQAVKTTSVARILGKLILVLMHFLPKQ